MRREFVLNQSFRTTEEEQVAEVYQEPDYTLPGVGRDVLLVRDNGRHYDWYENLAQALEQAWLNRWEEFSLSVCTKEGVPERMNGRNASLFHSVCYRDACILEMTRHRGQAHDWNSTHDLVRVSFHYQWHWARHDPYLLNCRDVPVFLMAVTATEKRWTLPERGHCYGPLCETSDHAYMLDDECPRYDANDRCVYDNKE